MDFEQHYGELTSDIRLNGIVPDGNSMPVNAIFLTKKFKKIIKDSGYIINDFMNVCFEKQQAFKSNENLTWELQDLVLEVFVIDEKKLFVKGKHFWVYAIGIKE